MYSLVACVQLSNVDTVQVRRVPRPHRRLRRPASARAAEMEPGRAGPERRRCCCVTAVHRSHRRNTAFRVLMSAVSLSGPRRRRSTIGQLRPNQVVPVGAVYVRCGSRAAVAAAHCHRQISVCSARARASCTSMPRLRTVRSSLVWPSGSCMARRLPVYQ